MKHLRRALLARKKEIEVLAAVKYLDVPPHDAPDSTDETAPGLVARCKTFRISHYMHNKVYKSK